MILCIDPGFRNFGCSVLDGTGTVINVGCLHTTPTKNKLLRAADDDVQRVTHITAGLSNAIHRYNIQGVLGELPPSGGQSAKGVKGLAMAMALSVALFTELNMPSEWATPTEVKKALVGRANASKEDMMKAACERHNWDITYKEVFAKKTKKLIRRDAIYHPLGRPMGKKQFEHIADSLGVFEALKHTPVARMLLKSKVAV
jgi:Holliday junction resolvasome RuvABC endonuclease subunit